MSGMVLRTRKNVDEDDLDGWEVGHYRPDGEWDQLVTGSFDAMATLFNFLHGGLGSEVPDDALN